MKRPLHLLTLLFTIVGIPLVAVAAPQFKAGETLTITEESADDLYLAGGTIAVEKPTLGDLFIAGGTVTVRGNVQHDAAIAGGTIEVESTIGDDLRALGGTVTIRGTVTDDLLVASGTVTLDDEAIVGGDLVLTGGTAVLGGTVRGNARIASGEVTVRGLIEGSVVAEVQNLTFTQDAHIGGDLSYTAPKEFVIPEGVVGGKVNFTLFTAERSFPLIGVVSGAFAVAMATSLFDIITSTFVAAVLLWIMRRVIALVAERGTKEPWANLGMGFLSLIGIPIVGIVLLVTIIGIPLAAILFLLYAVLLYLGKIATFFVVGRWLVKTSSADSYGRYLLSFISGAVLLAAVNLITAGFGMLLLFIFYLIGLGAIVSVAWDVVKKVRELGRAPASPPAPQLPL